MLSLNLHSQLAKLVGQVNALLDAAPSGAPSAEIVLRVEATLTTLDGLRSSIDADWTGPFGMARRHLGWLGRRHREGKPELAETDVLDLRDRDLPAVIREVGSWSLKLLDEGLVNAIRDSWDSKQYVSAVRDAFVYLETSLRMIGQVDPTKGLSGERLVNSLLAPGAPGQIPLRSDGLLGLMTRRARWSSPPLSRCVSRVQECDRPSTGPVHGRRGRGCHPPRQPLPSCHSAGTRSG